MRFNTHINNVKCKEWGLNCNQGAMFDLFNQLHSWADEIIIGNHCFYHISRAKIIEEIPLFYDKTDTVYRHFKALAKKGLIEYQKIGRKDVIRLTQKGKGWNSDSNPNSDLNPSKLGSRSELNSDLDPTYNYTVYNNNTNITSRCESFFKEISEINLKVDKPLPDSEVKKFFNWFSEHGLRDKKMRYEKEKTWNLKSRIVRWQERFANSFQGKQYYESFNASSENKVVPKMNLSTSAA